METDGATSICSSVKNDSPTVSIIMGAYNCEGTLPAALESISGQTFRDWQLVVCDDGSTDGTHSQLAAFSRAHPGQVTILRNETNRRLAYSLNRCLEHVVGDYVARMDGDDLSLPTRLEEQLHFLTSRPDVDLVGSWMQRFNAGGLHDIVSAPRNPDRWSMKSGVPFAHATIMARRLVFTRLEGYVVSPRTVRVEDQDLWFRFFAAGFQGVNLPKVLYLVREDSDAIRRRTLSVRWNSFRTSVIGHRSLGYPLCWLVWPALGLLKAAIPPPLFQCYRRHQAGAIRRTSTQTP